MAGRDLNVGWDASSIEAEHPFQFVGNAKDYFGIWIVNVLLTIVTLGIYASWAKVRNKKYFYGHTLVDNHNFDYHATGMQLFIGKIIVIAAFAVLVIVQLISPILYLIVLLALLVFIPAIIVRALRFNARVSSHRNVRFNFFGEYGDAFITYFLIPMGNVFTLYLCTPFVSRAANRFAVNNHTYGDRKFEFDADIGNYYKPFLIALGVAILLSILLMGPAIAALVEMVKGTDLSTDETAIFGFVLGFYAVLLVAVLPAFLYYQAVIRNVLFNNTILDGQHRFESRVNPFKYLWIVVSNTIAALVSIGLLVPWARVRLAKYMASCTTLLAGGPLDGYSSDVSDTTGVVSSEYVDMEGIDIGIGI